jgi:SPP1 family predicted phage head-tail adaptor
MISAHLMRHSLVIERATDGAVDDYNMPAQTWATLETVRGLVMPKTAEEVAQLSQGGPVASDHTIFLYPTDVQEADRIRFDPDDGRTYQIDAVRDAAGQGHHLELDAHVVTT